MDRETFEVVLLCVISGVIAFTSHAMIRHYWVASVVGAMVSVLIYFVALTYRLGYVLRPVHVVVGLGGFYALGIHLVVGLPMRLVRTRKAGLCAHCGYDLRGRPMLNCPRCDSPITPQPRAVDFIRKLANRHVYGFCIGAVVGLVSALNSGMCCMIPALPGAFIGAAFWRLSFWDVCHDHGCDFRVIGPPNMLFYGLLGGFLATAWGNSPIVRRNRRRKLGLCIRCGYNLEGLTEPRCPECGTAFEIERQI